MILRKMMCIDESADKYKNGKGVEVDSHRIVVQDFGSDARRCTTQFRIEVPKETAGSWRDKLVDVAVHEVVGMFGTLVALRGVASPHVAK